MKKLTYQRQCVLIFLLLGLGHLLAHLLKAEICVNIAWVIGGLLFVINPVYPTLAAAVEPKKGARSARIGGIIIILMGLMIRYGI